MQEQCITGLSVTDRRPMAVRFSDGVIRRAAGIPAAELDDRDVYIAPGLIDNQVNGYRGVDFSAPELSAEQVGRVVRDMWQMGVTSFLPTLITQPEPVLTQNLRVLAGVMAEEDFGSSMPGIHLEGPYISDQPGYRGAHNPQWIRPPDREEFLRLQAAAGGRITQITLAPELPGAMAFIEYCRKNQIIAALGHHAAPADLIHQAVEAGAAVSTHLGNACANVIDRHVNILWPQLADDRLMATIIADGHHLTSDELRVFYKVKGPENLIVVSDLTAFGGLEPGEYPWHGRTLTVSAERKVGFKDEQILAGAAMPLTTGIENVLRHTGCSPGAAIGLASRNPAKLNRLYDRGVLHPGYRADLIRFRLQDGRLEILETWAGGRCVFRH